MDIQAIMSIASVCVAVATFFLGRLTASHKTGKESGSLVTDIKYIKASIERLEKTMGDDVRRLEGRVNEISHQVTALGNEVTRNNELARSAHKRIDRVEGE